MGGVGVIPSPLHSLEVMAFLLYDSARVSDHGASCETGEVYFCLVYPAIFTEICNAAPVSGL